MKETPQFMKNIDAIRDIIKISQDNFCGRVNSWEDMKRRYNFDDLDTYKGKNNSKGINVLAISANTYTNYMNGKTYPSKDVLMQMLSDINEICQLHPVLKKCFRKTITLDQFEEHDLLKEFNDGSADFLIKEKFFGNYLCYYNATSTDATDKKTRFGVIRLSQGELKNEFKTEGVFSFKDEKAARKIFDTLQEKGGSLQDAIDPTKHSLFTGVSYLSPTLLWCTLSDKEKKEHVSMSFDLSLKITTKHPELSFVGSRGIALSQTSGTSNKTVTFPMVIISQPITASQNELTDFLCFNYSQIPAAALSDIADRITRLMESVVDKTEIEEELKLKLTAQIVKHEVEKLLKIHIFDSHYFLPKEHEDVYNTLLRKIRRADDKTKDPNDD